MKSPHGDSGRSAIRVRIVRACVGMFIVVVGVALFAGTLLLVAPGVMAQSDHACSTAYRIDKTLPTGTRWEMCWEPRAFDGILLYDITVTPPGGPRRLILAQAGLAQVHVPYDDNGARFHDVTDFGFGGRYLENLKSAECPDGVLIPYAGKNVICMQVQPRGYAQKYYTRQLQGYELSLFSVSTSGDYNYIVQWEFLDDGTINPSVGASGKLQRYGTDASYGWVTATNRIPISHYHNYWFRLDFDINGRANDLVQEIQFNPADSNRKRVKQVTDITTEAARRHDPSVQRSWRIMDTVTRNDDGNFISYQIEALNAGHDFTGPDFEPFSQSDLYVTAFKECEKYPSHNPALNGCASDVSQFVNGESVNGADLVVWYGITFHHLPREEDEAYMNVHWDGFTIIPRDWTSHNPLDTVSGGAATSTPTNTPTPVATATETPTVVATPVLSAVPHQVVLMAETLPQTVTVGVTATVPGSSLAWRAQSSSAWLIVSPITGTTPATLTLHVLPQSGLSAEAAAIYTGTVSLSSAQQPTQTVAVVVLQGLTERIFVPHVNTDAAP